MTTRAPRCPRAASTPAASSASKPTRPTRSGRSPRSSANWPAVSTSASASAELEQRGIFWRQPKKRSSQEYRSQKPPRHQPSGRPLVKNVYVFRLDQLPDDSDPAVDDEPDTDLDGGGQDLLDDLPDNTEIAGITGPTEPITGTITGEITGANMALTRSITGITGESDDGSCHVGARGPEPVGSRDSQSPELPPAGCWSSPPRRPRTGRWRTSRPRSRSAGKTPPPWPRSSS